MSISSYTLRGLLILIILLPTACRVRVDDSIKKEPSYDWLPTYLVKQKDKQRKSTALHDMAELGDIKAVKELLKKDAAQQLLTPDEEGEIPLHKVASEAYAEDDWDDHIEVIEELLKKDAAQQLLTPNDDGNIPLHKACSGTCVEELLKKDAAQQLFTPNNDGNIPLHKAAFWGYSEIVEELLKKYAAGQLFIPNNDGNIPLHLAAREEEPEIVEEFLKYSPKEQLKTENNAGKTPLQVAKIKIKEVEGDVNLKKTKGVRDLKLKDLKKVIKLLEEYSKKN